MACRCLTCTQSINQSISFYRALVQRRMRKVFRIGTVRYNCPMSAHASQAFSIAHCTDSEDLPCLLQCGYAESKRNVLRRILNVLTDGAVRQFSGREFQSLGAATEKR